MNGFRRGGHVLVAWFGNVIRGAKGEGIVTSPMPGRVLKLLVEPGQEVAAGEPLVVVEAMKMENEVTAPRAGIVLALSVAPGSAVGAGQIVCRLAADEPAV